MLVYLNWMVVVVWFCFQKMLLILPLNKKYKSRTRLQQSVSTCKTALRPCKAVLILDTKRNFIKNSMIFRGDSPSTSWFSVLSHDTSRTENWRKYVSESLVNFCNTSQRNIPVSSFKLTKSSELEKEERVQGRNSFPQRSTPSSRSPFYSPFLGQKTHPPHKSIKYGS